MSEIAVVCFGCGLQLDDDGKLAVKTQSPLKCDATNGLGLLIDPDACNGLTTSAKGLLMAKQLGISAIASGLALDGGTGFAMVAPPAGQPANVYRFTSPLTTIAAPKCHAVSGLSAHKVGGMSVVMQPNTIIHATLRITQEYVPNPPVYNVATPDSTLIYDTTGFTQPTEHDLNQLHDFTWQAEGVGQSIQLGARVEIAVFKGSATIVNQGAYEVIYSLVEA